ncbi:MAG: hypothetical protein JO219_12825 [Candidatus Eremiobacteraeota bacterium]|nr:hypothetical protein [Candidatus Eremiobacteraeota bacterium]MBV8365464.1 hypothetical protein [Candidatus Eremiobacteraeota bacterium]
MHKIALALLTVAVCCTALCEQSQADVVFVPGSTAAIVRPYTIVDADDRFASAHDVQGVVTSFDRFNMTLRVNAREYPVVLHQGTVIKPTGTTIAPSMVVNVAGYWQNGSFYANRIIVVRY